MKVNASKQGDPKTLRSRRDLSPWSLERTNRSVVQPLLLHRSSLSWVAFLPPRPISFGFFLFDELLLFTRWLTRDPKETEIIYSNFTVFLATSFINLLISVHRRSRLDLFAWEIRAFWRTQLDSSADMQNCLQDQLVPRFLGFGQSPSYVIRHAWRLVLDWIAPNQPAVHHRSVNFLMLMGNLKTFPWNYISKSTRSDHELNESSKWWW